jgi:hypothetical protein
VAPVGYQITRLHLAFDDGHWLNGKLQHVH